MPPAGRRKLHELVATPGKGGIIPQEMLGEMVEAIAAEYPELAEEVAHCVPP